MHSYASDVVPIHYADVFKIPQEISKPFLLQVGIWIDNCGVEWTVSRLKDMKLDFIRLKAGLEPTSVWIAKSGHKFKGPLGGLQTWCGHSWKRWSKAIQFLQMYTWFYSPVVTAKQERKFLDGVSANNVPIADVYHHAMNKSIQVLGLRSNLAVNPTSIVFRSTSSERREPHANGKSYIEGTATLECALSYTRTTRLGWDLRSKYKRLFDFVEQDIDFEDSRDCDVCDHKSSVGRIGLIQEAGYKLRAVANPGRIYQHALRPLKNHLLGVLKGLPWDCTHNQSIPVDFIQRHLKEGKITHSVDLSGATDYFPLDLQMVALRAMLPYNKDYLGLFFDLSRSPWFYKDTLIRWTKGQPLGLEPSFPAFALTHGLLLFALNGYRHDNMFFVLGDDVTILDDNLYRTYRAALIDLGCPVSESKSLDSQLLAEFAGKLITADLVVPQHKWRVPSDDSFIDVVRNFGLSACRLLRKRQRQVAKKLADVPDFMGGLGFNPRGIPLDQRILANLDLFDKERLMSYLMSYNRVVSSMNYYEKSYKNKDKSFPTFRNIRVVKGDFDQKSIALVLHFLPSLVNWYEVMGTNLFCVAPDLHLDVQGQAKRVTTLEHYENVFGL